VDFWQWLRLRRRPSRLRALLARASRKWSSTRR
jgi:hypothetical protein